MRTRIIDKIREAIRNGNYDLTHHALEEMAEDDLIIFDIENAILTGNIIKLQRNDPLGTKYIIEGVGIDKSIIIRTVGRFKETGTYLIITVYKVY